VLATQENVVKQIEKEILKSVVCERRADLKKNDIPRDTSSTCMWIIAKKSFLGSSIS
jgi:hypothetical protein